MSALPTELQVHILSFLPGEDVVRFKALNTFYRHIIVKNRNYLSFPKLNLHLSSNNTRIEITCKTKGSTRCYKSELNQPELSRVDQFKPSFSRVCCERFRDKLLRRNKCPLENKRKICSFFGQFFARDIPIHSLQKLFEFLLEKGDIDKLDLTEFSGSTCVDSITEAIKGSVARISYVETNIKNSPELYQLLSTIGNRKTARTSRVTLKVTNLWGNGWPGELNKIASFYKIAIGCGSIDLSKWITYIVENWKWNGYPPVNFWLAMDLRNGYYTYYKDFFSPWNIETDRLRKLFDFSIDGSMFKPLRLRDRDTGNVIQFNKKQTPAANRTRPWSLPSTYVSVTVNNQ